MGGCPAVPRFAASVYMVANDADADMPGARFFNGTLNRAGHGCNFGPAPLALAVFRFHVATVFDELSGSCT